ncbi:MAG: ABC transporter ATP-binding protein [Phycisphaerae bacterium]|nr:ABC transporter ATP-binding protein [Phycisphaerae bacterium]
MIELTHITKSFGPTNALSGVTLTIRKGETVGLLGPNGAGKSTLMRVITSFLPPNEGKIAVCGFDTIANSEQVRERIGYLPESNPIYPEMRVVDYLKHRAQLFRLNRARRRIRVDAVLEQCRLRESSQRRIGVLSKGLRQRVGLAAALLHEPEVLILDEPTSGLDPTQLDQARELLRELTGTHTMLISSHILPEIERTCNRVVILAGGRVRADGTPDQLLREFGISGGSDEILIEIQDSLTATATRALADVPDIAGVSAEPLGGGWTRLRARPKVPRSDAREPVARALAGASIVARDLHRERATLDRVFKSVIERAG